LVFFMPMRWASRFISVDEGAFVAGHGFGQRHRRVVTRLDHQAVQQVVDLTGVAGSMNIFELLPSTFQARTETLTIWSSVSFLSRMAPGRPRRRS
jgi:hypothetical protein